MSMSAEQVPRDVKPTGAGEERINLSVRRILRLKQKIRRF